MRWRRNLIGIVLASALLALLVLTRARPDALQSVSGATQETAYPPAGPVRLTTPSGENPGVSKDPCSKAMIAAFNARARSLSGRQDARSQLAYAMAVPFDPGFDFERTPPDAARRMMEHRHAEAQRALQRAATLAPDSPEILFLAASQCGSGAECRDVQQALLAAEPDNTAAWLLETAWARMRNDPDGSQRAFTNAAKATNYDTHADTRLQVMVQAYGDLALPAACSSETAKAELRRTTGLKRDFGMLDHALVLANASWSLPAYMDIRLQCSPQANGAMVETRVSACRTILARLADGDTVIERAIGLASMVELVADAPEAAAWRQRYREHQWLMEQWRDGSLHSELQFEDYALDEARSMQSVLEATGRWPAPAGWLPGDDRARSLILTGRPPPRPTR